MITMLGPKVTNEESYRTSLIILIRSFNFLYM